MTVVHVACVLSTQSTESVTTRIPGSLHSTKSLLLPALDNAVTSNQSIKVIRRLVAAGDTDCVSDLVGV
jgi:hypothetical protein